MPPGFMKAITASPKPGSAVAASCASAMTSPRVDSPRGWAEPVRVRSPWMRPMTVLASGAEAVTYCWTTRRDLGVLLGRVGLADHAGAGSVQGVLDDDVLGAGRHQLTGLVVDREGDVGQHAAERRGAGDQAGHAVWRRDRAAVLGVRVGGHDHLDGGIEPAGDVGDRTPGQVAGATVERGRAGLDAALVHDEDEGVGLAFMLSRRGWPRPPRPGR